MVSVHVNSHTIAGIELFVFDKDGTLIDLYTYWYHMIELRALGICSFYGLDVTRHKELLMLRMGVDVPQGRLRPEGPVGLLSRAVVQQAAEGYLQELNLKDVGSTCFQIFKDADDQSLVLLSDFIKPIRGAHELLREIKKKGGKSVIATIDRTDRAELALRFLDIGHLLDAVVGADQVQHPKPSADMLKIIGDRLGIPPERSVMIGDAKTDIQMGINAGFKASIAVCSGLTPQEELSRLTPYVIDDVSNIMVE